MDNKIQKLNHVPDQPPTMGMLMRQTTEWNVKDIKSVQCLQEYKMDWGDFLNYFRATKW